MAVINRSLSETSSEAVYSVDRPRANRLPGKISLFSSAADGYVYSRLFFAGEFRAHYTRTSVRLLDAGSSRDCHPVYYNRLESLAVANCGLDNRVRVSLVVSVLSGSAITRKKDHMAGPTVHESKCHYSRRKRWKAVLLPHILVLAALASSLLCIEEGRSE